jgi:cyclophilin family peptidyl-prolyl cis-trans isomerase
MAAPDTATVTLSTAKGDIVIKVTGSLAPHATANFVALAACGFYDGVVFHRLVPGFVIQGGDGEYGHIDKLDRGRLGTGGPGYKFADEPFEGDYVRGAVAMANAGSNTNGSQFFICLDDLSGGKLPKKYTLFGQVTAGMDVVDAIAASKRDGRDQPTEPTAMRSVKITE